MIAGIDYSMSCPAITVFNGKNEFNYDNCDFYYRIDKKKFDLQIDNICGTLITKWDTPMQRFHDNAMWTMDVLKSTNSFCVGIEDYSMGSKGKVFHIAENLGILKYNLYTNKGYETRTIPPSVIKKFATGKGNANKEKMEESFIEETGINLKKLLGQTKKQWSPSGDIIDSYYIAKYMWSMVR